MIVDTSRTTKKSVQEIDISQAPDEIRVEDEQQEWTATQQKPQDPETTNAEAGEMMKEIQTIKAEINSMSARITALESSTAANCNCHARSTEADSTPPPPSTNNVTSVSELNDRVETLERE